MKKVFTTDVVVQYMQCVRCIGVPLSMETQNSLTGVVGLPMGKAVPWLTRSQQVRCILATCMVRNASTCLFHS